MMRKLFFIFFAAFLTSPCFAQETPRSKRQEHQQRVNALIKQDEEGVITYRKQTDFGIKLTSSGYGGFFEIGRAQSIRKTLLFQLDISELKSPKEEKQSNLLLPAAPFIYGKENYFYPVKLGVQEQILLGNKSNKNGVSVSANFGGGIALGVLRPYFMQVYDSINGFHYVKYDQQDSALFLSNNPGTLIGGPSFGMGWSNLSVVPGIYLKGAFRFDYARYNEVVSALEIGVTADFYSKKIPLIVFAQEKNFFLGAYVSMVFGGRK